MQKYLHLLQIVETEKTVATQLRRQIEDGEIEIERLKAEVTAGRVQAPDQPRTPPRAPAGAAGGRRAEREGCTVRSGFTSAP